MNDIPIPPELKRPSVIDVLGAMTDAGIFPPTEQERAFLAALRKRQEAEHERFREMMRRRAA